jgi:ankyrin repeat protein
VLREFIAANPQCIREKDRNNQTLLQISLFSGNLEAVKEIVRHCETYDMDPMNSEGQTPLHSLFAKGKFQKLEEFLKYKSTLGSHCISGHPRWTGPGCCLRPNKNGQTLAFLALAGRHFDLLEIILSLEKDW